MIRLFVILAAVLIGMVTEFAFADSSSSQEKVTALYLNSDYGRAYSEQEWRLLGELRAASFANWTTYLGYANAKRQYNGGVDLDKNSLLLGTTYSDRDHHAYYEFGGLFSDTDEIGAKTSYGVMAHSTYFLDWDLGLGVENSTYNTGDVVTVKPQIIYIYKDMLFGVSGWFFEDNGQHSAWRTFMRWQQGDKWQEEISLSGGDSREDIGVIDQFFAYSVNVRRTFKNLNFAVSGERYEGHLRSGLQWGVSAAWVF
jgi:hypothetical protein